MRFSSIIDLYKQCGEYIYWDHKNQVVKAKGIEKDFDINDPELAIEIKKEMRKQKLKKLYGKS